MCFDEKNTIEVLIVEDEVVLAFALEASLEEMGFSVSGIESTSARIMNHVINHAPDVILMDINLNEDKNGIEIAEEIWKLYKIPIIFLTSYSNDKMIKDSMRCEPYGYLIKPCRSKELKATILATVHKHQYFFKNKKDLTQKSKIFTISSEYQYDIINKRLFKNNKVISLTKNEVLFIEVMLNKKGHAVSFEEISTYIWRESIYSYGKLRTLVYRLNKKINGDFVDNIHYFGYLLKVS